MEWIDVKEKLPNINDTVLSTNGRILAVTKYKCDFGCERWEYIYKGCCCCDGDMCNVTYWIPLPGRIPLPDIPK